ncbi:hypothetical protein N8T12_RS04190 [Escherichia coli]|uniref:hypothetical protein n=1 Tax=Escherichia coli TaxID=562 RepID=UPI0002C98A07|nr:hypothetical protein [Escherichia coli]EFF2581364.1 hypothetical protein [Escherichia coli]EFF2874436.1 hypothetical protein [Escherichia coli]EFP0745654.1 hypothetical protein [Escherichia coli]EHL8308888.1 hypothetical protein [Escherichia coli]EIY9687150.1 hypothetical protein [Escherichia coli]
MILTIKQIHELAIFAGMSCNTPEEAQVEAKTEITIDSGDIHDEVGCVIYSGLRAHITEYPEEGYIALE